MLVLEVVASCTCCLGFNISSILGAALSVDWAVGTGGTGDGEQGMMEQEMENRRRRTGDGGNRGNRRWRTGDDGTGGTGDGEQETVGTENRRWRTGDGDINHRLHTYYTNHFQPQLG